MPRACQLSASHITRTTKTLPIASPPSTLARVLRKFTLIAGIAAILDTADVVPLGPVWTAGPLAHKLVTACPWVGLPRN
jgi:hypothetical protein